MGGGGQPPYGNPLVAHKPGIIPLRPLTVGDILQAVFTAVRRGPGTYLGLTLVTWLVFLLVLGVVGGALTAFIWTGGADDLDGVVAFSGVMLLAVLGGFVSAALSGILAYPFNQQAIGRTPTVAESLRETRSTLPPLCGLYLLLAGASTLVIGPVIALTITGMVADEISLSMVLLILLLLAVVGAWVSVRFAFCLAAVVVERRGVFDALRRSFALTAGRFWRTFGVLFLVGGLAAIVSSVISGSIQTMTALVWGIGNTSDVGFSAGFIFALVLPLLGSAVAGIVTQPFVAITVAALHVDARIRSEGYDLVLGQTAADRAAGRPPGGWTTP
ncbi:glycerophosphoryl diester phosphodiesterase membrane domain-containing protein [Gordonia sp. LSe1-13]|uniref:Glycerophosphoryl diester phosphodiesterase membrane domain-containing protein n=1 Tax=Gordonia sesuvii TaxID=3116777 RepID=A0ABU7MFS0_9ACTN|nr:glycerophosphoryl diester phosphodiesterase membrane domain-containing protein [Gordonia sp. LSe1-13]